MYSAADLRKGIKIEIDGEPYQVTDFDFCKPGKGTALYRCKLKHMINGSTMDRTFRPVDKFERPDIGEREVVYSYHDGMQGLAEVRVRSERIITALIPGLRDLQ